MVSTIGELIAQRDALERQIHEARTTARAEAIAKIRELMSEHGLTATDITSDPARRARSGTAGVSVKPKYRDPMTGQTWTGRGLKPRWLSAQLENGKSISDFLI